jgi:hypothetical protein
VHDGVRRGSLGYYYLAKIYRFLGEIVKAKDCLDKGLLLQPYNKRVVIHKV